MANFVRAVFHRENRTIEFATRSGDRLLRSGGSLGWLFNNPGNLRPKGSASYPGQIGVGDTKHGKLCIFASVDVGRAEQCALLRRKYNHMSLRNAIYTYAPPTDNNQTERYLSFVRERTGFSDSAVLRDLSDAQLESLRSAMERWEGYDYSKETRKERWVHVTRVTLSDGARPMPNQSVTISRGGEKTDARTDAVGRLPPFLTVTPGEQVSLQVWQAGTLQCIGDFTLQERSRSIVLFRPGGEYLASFAGHNPRPANTPIKPAPIRYVIQPRDTVEKIAKRFKVDPNELVADNKATVRNPNRIFPGQVIWIYGKGGGATGSAESSSAASAQARKMPVATAPREPVGAVRSEKNKGHPLGVVPLAQKRAPWMETAVAQLKRWGGIMESVIDDTINYHKEIGAKGYPSMTGDKNPWCASFVNYCLKSAGYPHTGGPSSQSFSWHKDFKKVDAPVYGAIVVYRSLKRKGGHVAFVYCRVKGGDFAVLGGNQGQTISFNAHHGVYLDKGYRLVGFYVPASYYPFAKQLLNGSGDLGEESMNIEQLRKEFKQRMPTSREEQATL